PTPAIKFQIGSRPKDQPTNLNNYRNPFAATGSPRNSVLASPEGFLATHLFSMRKRQRVTRKCSRLKALMQNAPLRATKSNRSRVRSQFLPALTPTPVFRFSAPLRKLQPAT